MRVDESALESWRSNASESCNSHQLSSSFDRAFSLQLGHRGPVGLYPLLYRGESYCVWYSGTGGIFLTIIDMRIKDCIYNLQELNSTRTVQSKITMSARAADMYSCIQLTTHSSILQLEFCFKTPYFA
jgi:hypothetical protein